MKIAYFDCFSGVSGNMILGAFVDAGLEFSYLKKELAKLPLSGYRLNVRKVRKAGIAATELEVVPAKNSLACRGIPGLPRLQTRAGKPGQADRRRSLKEIKGIINRSRLSKEVRDLSCRIFEGLAKAESKAHGLAKGRAHFHEIGDTDSIIDVVGSAIALERMGLDNIYASAINTGSGTINTAHGRFPIPAPATAILLKGMPAYCEGKGYELATPTGVAILKIICEKFGQMPLMEIQQVGTGAGNFDTQDRPNVLRVFIGDAADETAGGSYNKDTVVVVQTNIDDMNPVGTECILERIFKAGALDVYFTPVYMKKTRMAILLSAITERKFLEPVLKTIFRETTTFGVRTYQTTRYKLNRVIKTVRSKYGSARVKIGGSGDSIVTVSPEYEDTKRLSEQKKAPFRNVYDEVKRAYMRKARSTLNE